MEIQGLPQLIRSLKQFGDKAAKGIERGLVRAGAHLLRESMIEVPVDLGFLRGSSFARKTGMGFDTTVQVGYSAAYAVFVHENMDALHGEAYNTAYADEITTGSKNSRGKKQKAKFLEDPMKREQVRLLQIVKAEVMKAFP